MSKWLKWFRKKQVVDQKHEEAINEQSNDLSELTNAERLALQRELDEVKTQKHKALRQIGPFIK